MKKSTLITLFTAALLFFGTCQVGWGQLLVENFDYTIGSVITATTTADPTTGWLSHSGNGTANIDVTTGLSFTGYAGSGIGGAANLDATGQDINKPFAVQSSGTVFAAFMIQTQNPNNASYFLSFGPATMSSTFYSRVWVNGTGTGVGISGSSAPGSYVTITPGTPTLLVIKYDFTAGLSSLYVLSSFSSTEPGSANSTFTETAAAIGTIGLRQYNAAQKVIVDGIRIGTSWASVCPSAIVAPTTQAYNLTFDYIGQAQMDVLWTSGNGAKRVVKMNTSNSFTTPTDGTDPTANAVYSGSGEQVVYNGTGSTIPTVTGLTAGNTYWYRVYEYNGSGSTTMYLNTTSTINPNSQATSASAVAPIVVSPTAASITATSALLGGTISSDGGSAITERGTVWSTTTPVFATDNKLAEGGTAVAAFTHSRTSLPSGTLIHYAAYATNGVGTTLSDEASFTTLKVEPSNYVTSFAAGTPTASSIPLTWTDATGTVTPDGYLILYNTTGTFANPADESEQTNGTGIRNVAQGIQTYTVTGLTASTPYYFKIWSYTNSGAGINYKTDGTAPTANATTTSPPSATVTLRPTHIDLSATTSESAVLMTLVNYPSDDARYRLYNGGNQYACWDAATNDYITSTSYSSGPQVPGTPSTSTTFWIVCQRGSNNNTSASYRDRLGAAYSSNYQTEALPAATEITTPFTLSGIFLGSGSYTTAVKHVVLAYSGATLVSAAATGLTTGDFAVVCPDGTTIDKIEIRAVDNTLIESKTGSWTATTDVGFIPEAPTASVWTGSTSSAWFIPGNWSAGVPGSTTNVTIPVVATNYPTITAAATCNNITIASGASLLDDGNYLTVSGTATVNRVITDATDDKWHLFISPITQSVQATATSCFSGAYVDGYNEASGAWARLATDDNVTSDQGYSLNFLNGTNTLVFPGTLKSSPVSYTNLSYLGPTPANDNYGKGWHLVGNPYTCGIDPALCAVPTGINAFAYVWNGVNYTTLSIGSVVNPGTIASLQGFFVRTNTATNSLTLANAAKTHGGTFLKSSNTVAEMLKLSIDGNGFKDEAYIRFHAPATNGFDQEFDAYKLPGIDDAPQLYSILPGEKATVNTLPSVATTERVPLGLKVGKANTYTLTASGIASFDASVPVLLVDTKLGLTQDLRLNPAYTFTAAPGDAENRFNLSFASVTGINKPVANDFQIYTARGVIHINQNANSKGTVYVYTAAGQLVSKSSLSPNETLLNVNAQGVYFIKVVTDKKVVSGKVVVSQPQY